MNGLHFAIATLPLAMYLILMGSIRLRKLPMVTTGWRDTAALGIAILGLVLIGPMQLFFPTYAGARWPGIVWIALIVLYGLCLLLVVLNCRPRLIVYGIGTSDFYTAILKAAASVDPAAHWEGQILNLPAVGMQLVEESTGSPGAQQLTTIGGLASVEAWNALEKAIVDECKRVEGVPGRKTGTVLVAAGALLIAAALGGILISPAETFQDLQEFILR